MLARRPNPGRRQLVDSITIPAPVGGMNSVVPASELPATDCIALYNMVGSEYGLRSRFGFEEWALGLDGPGLTEIPFNGSRANGAGDRQFYTTASGIWDVTTSTTNASRVVAFPATSSLSGYGISAVVATLAGHFLLYCDEANGLYIYSENSASWSKAVAGVTQTWAVQTLYTLGNHVVNGGNVYVVTAQGTSATTGSGPSGTGTSITDGGVTWSYVSAAPTGAFVIGPSLADQQNGLTLDPANLVFATVWKNRVCYLERDTSRIWYGTVNAFAGTFTSFDFGLKLQHGGPLAGIYNWAYDGGGGMDTRLVGISTAGDIVIYGGTDPNSASTFGLIGCWYVGAVPAGRRIATDFGGDLLINSVLGTLSLAKLVVVDPLADRTQYATYKIGNLFSFLANTNRTLPGWAIHIHPEDNALLILIPQGAAGTQTTQLAYSFANQAWGFYRDLPMVSAGAWNGALYFATPDGRICRHTGYVDNVKLSDPNSYVPVSWSIISRYANNGTANTKRIVELIPSVLSESPSPSVTAEARYNYDLSEAGLPSTVYSGTDYAVWDVSKWDQAVWAGDYTSAQPTGGALGMGRDVAVAIRGQADSRTILVDVKVLFETARLC